nr:bile acid:sodium symporter family protein [Methylonatrum kenyense]
MSERIANTFLVWVLLGAVIGLLVPAWLQPLSGWIPPLLGLVMLGMGMTLKLADFSRIVRRPGPIFLAAALQWTVMPLAAWLLAMLLNLPPLLAAGLILVGAAPGGTASNVVTLLARGDVALSVSITALTTVAAPLIMPLWILLLLGETIDVRFGTLVGQIALIVLLPVLTGLILRHCLDRLAPSVGLGLLRVFPALSALAVALIVAIIVAANSGQLVQLSLPLVSAVILHNGIGLLAGFLIAGRLGLAPAVTRSCGFEVGMQNSGLAVTLAMAHFGPGAALAGVLFSVWHNISGAALAGWLRRRPLESSADHHHVSR